MEQLELLDAVREVCSLVDAEHPEAVTQAAFNQARAQVSAPLPRADKIVRLLKVPWRKLLAAMHDEGRDVTDLLVHHARNDPGNYWLSKEHIVFSLRLVALRLEAKSDKPVKTLTPARYRAERDRVIADDQSLHAHGTQLRLPTEHQITTNMARWRGHRKAASSRAPRKGKAAPQQAKWHRDGAWDAALALASLAPSSKNSIRQEVRALNSLELIERMYEIFGVQPTSEDARRFVRANGIASNPDRDMTWTEAVTIWKKKLRARGIKPPAKPPPRSQRPDYTKDIGARRPGEEPQNYRRWHDLDTCLTHVIEYLEQVGPEKRSTRHDYDHWVGQRRGTRPYMAVLRQHGTWNEIRAKAQAKMRERAALATTLRAQTTAPTSAARGQRNSPGADRVAGTRPEDQRTIRRTKNRSSKPKTPSRVHSAGVAAYLPASPLPNSPPTLARN